MRIGIVTTWFERGAAYVSRQYRRVLEKEHTIFIYARGGEKRAEGNPEWDDERVTWGKLPVVPLAHSVELNDFAAWVKRNALDIVFFNEQHWWEPVILCARLGVIAGSYVDYYTEQTVPLFGCYDFLICNTRRHYSVFDWHPQAFFVPWGTEVNVFQPTTLDPVEPGKVAFFHSAGMNPVRKGTDLLIEAFAAVEGPARLVIHTQMDVSGLFPRLRTKLEELRTTERIEYIEKSVPAPGLYHLGDVYVYPSRLDGIGLTVPEALACGLPVIAPDCAPMNEFLDGMSGSLVPVAKFVARHDGYYWPQSIADVNGLRIAMQRYVDRIDSLGERKRCSRLYAERHLDWYRNASNLCGLFGRIRPIPAADRTEALQKARAFEDARSRLNLRTWLSVKSPALIQAARLAWRAISPRS